MRFATAIASLSFLSFTFAQNVVTIKVGATQNDQGGIFQFIPPTANATNGTVINFQFTGMPGNHSITQSTFSNPCTPVDGGFDSGWVFLPQGGLSPVPEWNLTITDDSKPIWFFCKQLVPSPHCIAGMVGAINAPATGNTFENYRNQALQASNSGQNQNGLVGIGASASARPEPVPSGATLFPTGNVPSPTNPSNASGSGGAAPASSSAGAPAGLTVQSGLVAAVVGVIGTFLA